MTEKIFIKITNKDIYDKLCAIEAHVIETNGKVRMNRLISRAGFCLALLTFAIVTGLNIVGLFGVI